MSNSMPPPPMRPDRPRGMDSRLKILIVAGGIILLILAAIGGVFDSTGGNSGTSDDTSGVQGNPDVYERIASETDCGVLQMEFDQAMDNAEARQPGDPLRAVSLDYADAADARLEELGC
jgi:hypothetical protein